jgi:integrase/recombinase XerD
MSAEHQQAWTPAVIECIKLYLDEQVAQGKAKSTITNYRQRLEILTKFLISQSVTTIDSVTPDVLKRYYQSRRDKGLKPHTIDTDARYIRAWLNYLVEIEIIDKSPMRKVKMPKLPKLQKPAYTVDDVKKLLSVASDKEELIVMLLIDTGVRSTELCRLTAGDIDIGAGTARVRSGKGNKDRTTFIGNSTRKCLIRYWRKHGKPQANEPLIRSMHGKDGFMTRSGMKYLINELGKKAGVEGCTVHRFRRTFAQWSRNNDMDIRDIQLLLGHSDIQTTVIYLGDDVAELKRKHNKFGPIDHNL